MKAMMRKQDNDGAEGLMSSRLSVNSFRWSDFACRWESAGPRSIQLVVISSRFGEGSDTDPTPGSTSSLGDTRISKANRGPYRPAPFNGTRTTTASSLWTISLENE